MCTQVFRLVVVGALLCASPSLYAYQVWTSFCKTPKEAAVNLKAWETVAKGITGLNINMSPGKFQPNDDQKHIIYKAYKLGSEQTFQPWAHPEQAYTDAEAAQVVGKAVSRGKQMGYQIKYVMIYDSRSEDTGKGIDKWKPNEVEQFRAWLDANGHKDIKIMYNARSYGSRLLLEHPAIAAALNEGSAEKWLTNSAGRHKLLQWFVDNPKTKNKEFFFQITVHHDFDPSLTEDTSKAFANTRLLVRSISADILKSTTWIRSDKVIFLPMSYRDYTKEFPFLPEYESEDEYAYSMTGLLCSLIEQRSYFEGREKSGLITVEQCKSRNRLMTD